MTTTLVVALVLAAALLATAVVGIVGYCWLAGYIVHKTGTTDGISDIGHAVAAIIAAIRRRK